VTTTSLSQLERLKELVSPRVGLIRSVTPIARGAEEPNPPLLYQAILSNFDFSPRGAPERAGTGKGETESEAMTGAICEAVERYCAFHPDLEAVVRARYADVAEGGAMHPSRFVLFSEEQYAQRQVAFAPFDDQREIGWSRAWNLSEARETLIPASLAYLNYGGPQNNEYLCVPSSNGFAAGPDLDFAVLGGLYELVERDGFLMAWMNRLPLPRVDFSDATGLPNAIRRHYERFGIELQVFNATTDIPIAVMIALAIDRSRPAASPLVGALPEGQRGPAAVVGLGCHLNPAIALRKALLEICQTRAGETRRFRREAPARRVLNYTDVREMEDHTALFDAPERLPELDFLLSTPHTQRLVDIPNRAGDSVRADLERCVAFLGEAGSQVAYLDVTTPDIAERDLCVARVIATELQPIHFGYGQERLGGRRLFETPRRLGYTPGDRTAADLNPCPHPLA
jgi:ribosomal protein S12 methylthiotransferase accessory factor